MEPKIDHVSDTAYWVAAYRAKETLRPDALFRDPFAARLAGEKGAQISRHVSKSVYVEWSVVIRTAIIDTFIKEQTARGLDLVLNLGAGLDTRPYRLDLPRNLRWVEADFPHVIAMKAEKLKHEKPNCLLERRSVDLSNDDARAALLDDLQNSAQKILVLTEGVLPYLSNEQVSVLAADLARRDHFQLWVADYYSPLITKRLQKGKRLKQFANSPFLFSPADWFDFFRSRGWRDREVKYLSDESARFGRKMPTPLIAHIARLFVSAKKYQEIERHSAYVLLERAP
jgi:methyltransferase (TIGR00027 family)